MGPPIGPKALYEARDLMQIEEFESPGPGSTKDYIWWRLAEKSTAMDRAKSLFPIHESYAPFAQPHNLLARFS